LKPFDKPRVSYFVRRRDRCDESTDNSRELTDPGRNRTIDL